MPEEPGLLALRCCPACEYSLEALPPEGICPECGQRYDQRFIVLSGRGRGPFDSLAGGTWRGVALQAGSILILLWIASRARSRDAWFLGLMGALCAVTVGMQLYGRFFSDHEPRWQLWLSVAGVAQVASTPEARFAHQAQRWLWSLLLPVMFVVIAFGRTMARGRALVTAAVILVACAFAAQLAAVRWWRRRRRTSRDPRAGDEARVTPDLGPWTSVDAADVHSLANGRARVRVWATRRWGRVKVAQQPIVDMELDLSGSQSDELRRRLAMWMPLKLK